jgi:hypothetical protein
MQYVQLLDKDINIDRLKPEVFKLLNDFNLTDSHQVSLTSIDGNNDWHCSVGKILDLKNSERFYSTLNKALQGSYIADLIARYSKYYRWRLLRLLPRETYSVHSDSINGMSNYRVHIPVVTNEDSFLVFCSDQPKHQKESKFYFEHLTAGNSYVVNTTGLHTAINYGYETRYHIVGVRYENSNNRTQ